MESDSPLPNCSVRMSRPPFSSGHRTAGGPSGPAGSGDLPQLRDDVLIDLRLVVGLGGGADLGLDVVLIPEVQPLPEGHLRPDLLRLGAGHRLPELFQLLLALPFRLGQDILCPGQALLVVADDHPPSQRPSLSRWRTEPSPFFRRLPMACTSFRPVFLPRFQVFPRRFSRKPPTMWLASCCMSGVTWV